MTLRQAIDATEPQIATSFRNRPTVEAAIRHALGESYAYLGEMTLAIQQLERAVALRRQYLGMENPDLLNSMSKLGTAYAHAGKGEQAFAVLNDALVRRTKRLGPDHPDTIQSMGALATALWRTRKLDQAVALLEKALELSKARLGSKHEITLELVNNLCVVYLYNDHKAEKEKAIPLLEGLLDVRKATLGPEHLETVTVMHNLAQAYMQAHKVDRAVQLYEEAFKLAKAKLGVEHPSTRNTLHWLTAAYRDSGQVKNALAVNEDMLSVTKARLGPEHRSSVTIVRRLAGIRAQMGQFAEAAADYLEHAGVNPADEDQAVDYDYWLEAAPLLIQRGSVAEYRELCRAGIERFGKTEDPRLAHRVSKSCLILPQSGVDLGIVDRLVDAALKDKDSAPYHSTKALAEYRQRRFASAAHCAARALAALKLESPVATQTLATLAMAHHQLKDRVQAQATLKRARDEIAIPTLESDDLGSAWFDVIIAHLLLREATGLVEGSSDRDSETDIETK